MRNGLVGAKIQRNQSSQENSQGWSHETNGRDQRTWSKIGKFLVCNLVNCKFLPEQSSNKTQRDQRLKGREETWSWESLIKDRCILHCGGSFLLSFILLDLRRSKDICWRCWWGLRWRLAILRRIILRFEKHWGWAYIFFRLVSCFLSHLFFFRFKFESWSWWLLSLLLLWYMWDLRSLNLWDWPINLWRRPFLNDSSIWRNDNFRLNCLVLWFWLSNWAEPIWCWDFLFSFYLGHICMFKILIFWLKWVLSYFYWFILWTL